MHPALSFLLRIGLVMQALFWFRMKFKVIFQFCEEGDGDSVESINYFGQYSHFHNTYSF